MNFEKPTFSILMPTFNHANYIGEAIESVLQQSFQDFELIICNDGSTDDTVQIISKFKDKRIKVVSKPQNYGVVSALNSALFESSGKYVCWLSSDDLFEPHKLALHAQHHKANPSSEMSIAPYGFLENGKKTSQRQPKPPSHERLLKFLQMSYINGLSVCITRKMFTNYGVFDSRYAFAQDVERWFSFLSYVEPVFLTGEAASFSRKSTSVIPNSHLFSCLDFIKLIIRLVGSKGFNVFCPQGSRPDRDFYKSAQKYLFEEKNPLAQWGIEKFILAHYVESFYLTKLTDLKLSASIERDKKFETSAKVLFCEDLAKNPQALKYILEHSAYELISQIGEHLEPETSKIVSSYLRSYF